MARRGENIFRRKDGRWEARYISHYENGKAKYVYLYGRTYTEAKAKREAAMGRCQFESRPRGTGGATVEQLARMWLGDARHSVKESTFARYLRIVDRYIAPHLGALTAAKCDGGIINGFTRTLLEQGGGSGGSGGSRGGSGGSGGLSPKTVTDILCVLKYVIKYAGESGHSFGNTDNIRFPQREAHDAVPLDAANRTALERVVMDSGDSVCLGILFAMFCGLRIGEVCGLRWEDVNIAAGTVRIRRTVERVADLNPNAKSRTKLIIGEPKTRSSLREIPLPGFLVGQLERFEQKAGCYLLTNRDTPCEPSVFYGRYKSFMRRQGRGEYNFHALRHTFATRCVEEGFDIKSLSEILGHSNVSTTLGIYVHPTMEQKRAQMERLKPATKAETV